MAVGGGFDRASGRLVFEEATDFFNEVSYFGDRTGPTQKVDLPSDAVFQFDRGWLAIKPRSTWQVAGHSFPPDTVLGIGLDAFLAGDRSFAVLFEPAERRALQGFSWVAGSLLISVLDELRPVFLLVEAGSWTRRDLAVPQSGTAFLWKLDIEEEETDGTLLALVQDPLTPPTLSMLAPGLAAPTVLKHTPPAFDADGLVVTRHEAVSSDGERIPYVQSGPPGETGDAPVHMTGYGGFRVSSLPNYAIRTGKLWLERGGTAVVANIRGGGEFGTRWHEAGRREGKRLSHDDFAAVAADLVRRGVTRPGRIAAEGGSNGGLLIANMLTRYPRAVRRAVLHHPADRHAPLYAAAGGRELDRGIRRPGGGGGLGVPGARSPPTTRPSRAGRIRRSCSPPPAGTTACILATRARWRPSCRRWATTRISTNRRRAVTATARTMRRWRRSPHSG